MLEYAAIARPYDQPELVSPSTYVLSGNENCSEPVRNTRLYLFFLKNSLVVRFVNFYVSAASAFLIEQVTTLDNVASHEPGDCHVLTSRNVREVFTDGFVGSITAQIIVSSVSTRVNS